MPNHPFDSLALHEKHLLHFPPALKRLGGSAMKHLLHNTRACHADLLVALRMIMPRIKTRRCIACFPLVQRSVGGFPDPIQNECRAKSPGEKDFGGPHLGEPANKVDDALRIMSVEISY